MKIITCNCGYEATGNTDEEVMQTMLEHIVVEHPQTLEKQSRQEVIQGLQKDIKEI